MASYTSIAKVKGNPSTPVSTRSSCTTLSLRGLLSSHLSVPPACIQGVLALMYSPISDPDAHPSCVMRPSYAS